MAVLIQIFSSFAIAKFPLRKGDILRQDIYEEAKERIKSPAPQPDFLDADFPAAEGGADIFCKIEFR